MLGLRQPKFLDSFGFCIGCLWSPRCYGHNLPKYLRGQFYSHKAIWRDKNHSDIWVFAEHSVAGLAIMCTHITSPFNFNKPLPSCFKNVALNLTLLLVINNFPNQRVCLIKIRLQILILIGMKCCNIMHKALVKWQFT